ncbi:ankyrin repeat domain-containing protein [Corynebacterium felinum]|uniref:Ankyrin repeat protein n=1 Tax=Corynebacterium felinum TaxID=131318 RepID=A0ABU2B4N0_9CORY|nr:ankyrin repeat domain-containing protein [Corynebacterium felinum]MDF5820516.1 ankyrin repeat domain-containing protein [Corynebacterium felinum]MDR7353574.1 ankyrin repeat protein [Corynebacterium felinum]WJY95754.1 Ankyrin repeats (3 copies) [Corynebacterium felinum]
MAEFSTPHTNEDLPEDLQAFVTELFTLARTGGDGAADRLAQYIQAGLSPNLTNHEGNTLLMLAAYNGHADVVTQLAELGADVNQLNDRGQSPLAGAIFKKEEAVIEALLAAGADPRAGHPTAIDCANMFGNAELAQRLSNA